MVSVGEYLKTTYKPDAEYMDVGFPEVNSADSEISG
jgi:hypothetical protein